MYLFDLPFHAKQLAAWAVLCCMLFAANGARSETVEARLLSGVLVSADYHSGKATLPAVLLLHGFLQTRDFPTISRLAEGLSEAGYSVLSPTLSLGVSKRAQSLPCEAIHNHSMQGDISEIDYWVKWLKSKGHHNIVLAGHSFAAVQLLAYSLDKPDKDIDQMILISILDVTHKYWGKRTPVNSRAAKQKLAQGDRSLSNYEIGFCRKYPSTASAYLSYQAWVSPKILDGLAHIKIPVDVILGGNDDFMVPELPRNIQQLGIPIKLIKGANHFFGEQYEFDLLDAVLASLKQHQAGK